MGAQASSLFALYPAGFPAALVIGSVVNLQLFIPGEPVSKLRHRSRVVQPRGGKAFVQTYPDKKTVEYEQHVSDTVKEQIRSIPVSGDGRDFTLPISGRVMASLRFNMHKPVSYGPEVKHHLKRPDVDNLAKAILDALQNAGVIVEDNIVTDLSIAKRYQDADHPQGVEIDLTAFG